MAHDACGYLGAARGASTPWLADGADLAFAPIEELAPRLHTREVSPIELADLTLRRIEAINPRINAYYTVLADELRTDAERARSGRSPGVSIAGPLHGVPICIKDIYESGPHDLRVANAAALQSRQRERWAVRKLRNAGALIAGKAATFEFAYGMPSRQSPVAPVRNPWNEERQAGGIEQRLRGSGRCGAWPYAGMGSCTGGSIRWPAQCCHLVGAETDVRASEPARHLPARMEFGPCRSRSRATVRDAALMLQGCARLRRGRPPPPRACRCRTSRPSWNARSAA